MASPQFASLNGILNCTIAYRWVASPHQHTARHHLTTSLNGITTSTHRKASPHHITKWHHYINTPHGITTPFVSEWHHHTTSLHGITTPHH
jgi:hypothetical protein